MKNKRLWVSILAGVMAAVMLLGLIVGLIPAQASAASSAQLKTELNNLRKQKKELQEQYDKLKAQFDENMDDMEGIIAEKNIIDQEIGILNQEILNINEQITNYSLLIADKQDELDQAKAHLEELSDKNKERIRAMEEDGALSYWSVLFKANSFADLLDRLNMIQEIAAADQRRLKEMSEAAEVVAQAREALAGEKAALEDAKAQLDVAFGELEVKRLRADEVLAELNAKSDDLYDLMGEAEADVEMMISMIADKEKEYNQALAAEEEARRREEEEKRKEEEEANKGNTGNSGSSEGSGSSGDSGSSSAPTGGNWIIPCKYRYLSSPYGWRIHPVYGTRKFHSGVDLAAAKGTPIKASRGGTVTTATYNSSCGYYVTINHGDGFSSSYLHMTHYVVKVGQKVSQGDVIGYVGSTGVSTGNHLHFTIYYNGNTVNPANYVSFY